MKIPKDFVSQYPLRSRGIVLDVLKRLEEVPDPERHLVGDVAERIPQQDDVEETKSGRRDVGKIGGADDPLGIIDRQIEEARQMVFRAKFGGYEQWVIEYNRGWLAGLEKLRAVIAATVSQRSDLPNA